MKLPNSALVLAFLMLPATAFALETLGPVVEIADKTVPEDVSVPEESGIETTALSATNTPSMPTITAEGAAVPALSWEDDLGTNLGLWDDTYVKIPIGFSFSFYGITYTELFVGSNGYVTFGRGDGAWYNIVIPNPVQVPRITVSYTDWNPLNGAGQNVYANLVGEVPNRRLVVTWWQIPGFGNSPPAPNSFQIQLFESGSKIQFGYKEICSSWPNYRQVVTGLDSSTGQYILSADITTFPSLIGTNICYTPTANGYEDIRLPCNGDSSPPQIQLPPNMTVEAVGSSGAPASFAVTANDDSDPAPRISCSHASGSTFGIGTTEISCSATDRSGNSSSGTFSVTVRDTTSPTILCPGVITVPVNTPVTDSVILSFLGGASASDMVDGDIAITNTVVTTDTVGTRQVVFTASDDHGNSANCSSAVKVNYRSTGFYAPIDMPPVTNTAKAGSTVPLKWSLPNGIGGYFTDLSSGALSVRPSVCGSLESELPPEQLTTSGSSGLHYDSSTNQFVYNWKTSQAQAGNCFVVTLTLNDASGSTISSLIKLR